MTDSETFTFGEVLNKYHSGKAFVTSADGVIKIICTILNIISATVFISGNVCASYRVLNIIFPSLMGVSVVFTAIAYIGNASRWNKLIPEAWLYINIILSTAAGMISVVMGILSLTVCSLYDTLHYVPGPLAIIASALLTISVASTYLLSNKRWKIQSAAGTN